MYGIKENSPKTPKANCFDHDLQSIINAFAEVEHAVDTSSIKHCFRLWVNLNMMLSALGLSLLSSSGPLRRQKPSQR